jgi:hypothetical protein
MVLAHVPVYRMIIHRSSGLTRFGMNTASFHTMHETELGRPLIRDRRTALPAFDLTSGMRSPGSHHGLIYVSIFISLLRESVQILRVLLPFLSSGDPLSDACERGILSAHSTSLRRRRSMLVSRQG